MEGILWKALYGKHFMESILLKAFYEKHFMESILWKTIFGEHRHIVRYLRKHSMPLNAGPVADLGVRSQDATFHLLTCTTTKDMYVQVALILSRSRISFWPCNVIPSIRFHVLF